MEIESLIFGYVCVCVQAHLPSLPPSISLSRELFGGTNTGINFDKYEDIPVEVSGEHCPMNVDTFADCNFSEIIRGNIKVRPCHLINRIDIFEAVMGRW